MKRLLRWGAVAALLGLVGLLAPQIEDADAGPRRGARRASWDAHRLTGGVDADAVLVVAISGQSNARGYNAYTPLTDTPLANTYVLCADDATIQALDETDLACMEYGTESHPSGPVETPLSGLVYSLRQRLLDHGPAIIGVRCGENGTAISQHDPDLVSGLYQDCLDRIGAVVTAVAASPGTYGTVSGRVQVLGLGWWQGESDSIAGTAAATYQAALEEIVDEFVADVVAATGQVSLPRVVAETPLSYGTSGDSAPTGAVLGQLAACASRTLLTCIGGNYAADGVDNYHKTAGGQRLAGELAGTALYLAVTGSALRPPTLLSASAAGTSLTACFDVAAPPLVLDTTTTSYTVGTGDSVSYGCPAHRNGSLGLEVYDTSGSPPTLSSVSLSGSTCVQGTLSAELDSADSPTVRVAWSTDVSGGALSRFSCQDTTDGVSSNIRDSRSPLPVYALTSEVVVSIPDAGVDAGVDAGFPDAAAPDATVPDAGSYASTLAYEFNGTDERIGMGDVTTADGAVRLKIAFWIRWAGSQGFVISRRAASQRQFAVSVLSTGRVRLFAAQTPATDLYVETAASLTSGTWTHVIVDYDASEPTEGARIFFDGVDQGSLGGSLTSIANLSTPSSPTSLYIASSAAGLPLAMRLAHPAIWVGADAAAMDEAEVYASASDPSGAPDLNSLATTPPPDHWWPADNADLTTSGGVLDEGDGTAHGTAENMDATDLVAVP